MSFVLNGQQTETVRSMIRREHEGSVPTERGVLHTRLGINGNEAGSGKTRAMLALVHEDLQHPHMHIRPYTHIVSRGFLAHEETVVQHSTTHRTTIVLANGSIRRQWIQELKAGNCLRYILLDNVRKLASFVPDEIDVAIVSTTVYKELSSRSDHYWHRFIYDETDSYIFPGMGILAARFTWFVTATWATLERFTRIRSGRLSVNHAIRRLLLGTSLQQLVVHVPSRMDLPAIENHLYRCRAAVSIASAVMGYVEPDVMRQIETGDIQGAIQALGGDSSTINVVDLVRIRLGRSLQEAELRVHLNRGNREAWTLRVAKLQRDISLVNDRFRSILNENCSICMDTLSNPVLTTCHHVFCLQCIVPWFQRSHTCPQCRTPLRPDQVTTLCSGAPVGPVPERTPVAHTMKTRMEHVEKILADRRPDQRILIFSEYDTSLDTIQSILGMEPYGVIQGHSSTRAKSISKFKSGELPILLLNSRMNGAGIDLPETTDIILFHAMSASMEEQVIGRGQRMGRTSALHVHRFV